MIYYSTSKYIPVISNFMSIELQGKEDETHFVIVSKSVLNQGTILYYHCSPDYLNKELYDIESNIDITDIYNLLPTELREITKLLKLMNWNKSEPMTLQDKFDSLTAITSIVNAYRYLTTEPSSRQELSIVSSAIDEGRLLRENFFRENCIKYNSMLQPEAPPRYAFYTGVIGQVEQQYDINNQSDTTETVSLSDLLSMDGFEINTASDNIDEQPKEEEKEQEKEDKPMSAFEAFCNKGR